VIVTGYDQIAYGAINEASAAGYRIPEDISLVGIDDIPTSQYGEIQLSSLYVDFESACPKIVELIYKRIENRYYRAREQINIPVKLNVRGSLLNKNK
jgi:DNA-binding LacI/PurR family transcriptional regulator